jgi:hypothetical protein
MLPLLMALLLAPPPSSLPDRAVITREQASPAPVTDKDLRPAKLPDCRSNAAVQRQLDAMKQGEIGECFIRDITALNRR